VEKGAYRITSVCPCHLPKRKKRSWHSYHHPAGKEKGGGLPSVVSPHSLLHLIKGEKGGRGKNCCCSTSGEKKKKAPTRPPHQGEEKRRKRAALQQEGGKLQHLFYQHVHAIPSLELSYPRKKKKRREIPPSLTHQEGGGGKRKKKVLCFGNLCYRKR